MSPALAGGFLITAPPGKSPGMKFLKIHICSIMASERLPRVDSAVASGCTDRAQLLSAKGLQPGGQADMDQLMLAVRMSTEDALCSPWRGKEGAGGGSVEKLPSDDPLRRASKIKLELDE